MGPGSTTELTPQGYQFLATLFDKYDEVGAYASNLALLIQVAKYSTPYMCTHMHSCRTHTPPHTCTHSLQHTGTCAHTQSHSHSHTHTHKHVHTQTQSLSEYSVICFRLNLVAHPQLLGFFLTLFEVFITWTFTPQCMHCKRANYADKSPSELFNERKRKHLKLAVTCTHALAHTHTPLHNCMCIYMIL